MRITTINYKKNVTRNPSIDRYQQNFHWELIRFSYLFDKVMLVDICKTASWAKLSKYILGVEIIVCDQKGDTEEQDIMKEMTRRHLIEVDEFQNTPLLLACYNEAPLEAIKALIFLSEVAGDPETILTRDHTNDGASG